MTKKKDRKQDEPTTVSAVAANGVTEENDTIAENKTTELQEVVEETGVEAAAAKESTMAEGESTEEMAVTAETEESSLEEQLEQAQQEAANNLEGWQRAVAELANFKRRQEEQQKLQRDRIKAEVIEGVLSALDDMELAFQNTPAELDGQLLGWVEGFRLVQRKLDKTLEDQNVMPINTEGEFDPNFHEAVSYEDSDEHEEGQIIAEVRKGYQIGNRVMRPALVRVAK